MELDSYLHDLRLRRRWLLLKALETKELPEALDLAWAAECFLLSLEPHEQFPPSWGKAASLAPSGTA
jgi:hypothetical protein